MKKLKRLRLNQLSKEELKNKEMNLLRGGSGCCLCGCNYSGYGGASSLENGSANAVNGQKSYPPLLSFGWDN